MAATLEGRVAIVTGSTRGIGKAVAVAMARDGARVVVCGRSSGPDTGEGVGSIEATVAEIESDGGEAIGIRCDISREEDATGIVAGALERWGRVDVLVNNAASLWRQGLLNTTPAKWRELLHTNLDGVYYCTHAVLPSMMQQGGGSIISLTSGRSNAIDGKTTAYTIAKTHRQPRRGSEGAPDRCQRRRPRPRTHQGRDGQHRGGAVRPVLCHRRRAREDCPRVHVPGGHVGGPGAVHHRPSAQGVGVPGVGPG